MNIIKWAIGLLLTVMLAPFYFAGATLGLFLGAAIQGHSDSLSQIRYLLKSTMKKMRAGDD